MNELALFAGAGGGILGGKLLGWRTVCAVEFNAYAASVLLQRQNDGLLPAFPVWDDVCTFDGEPWRGIVDVISGGFPCQDISAAGKGEGITGERSGLWKEFARIIREVRPPFVFVENSPILTSRGLDVVLADLAAMGFDAEWGVLSAAEVGANHKRDRMWIMAYSSGERAWCKTGKTGTNSRRDTRRDEQTFRQADRKAGTNRSSSTGKAKGVVGNAVCDRRNPWRKHNKEHDRSISPTNGEHSGDVADNKDIHAQGQLCGPWQREPGGKSWWSVEPNVGRVANGVAARVDRLTAIGNGQVPLCAATAWKLLGKRLNCD